MKVLLSAFACRPHRGSEPLVGWRTLLAAARRHDVWLLTNDKEIPLLRAALAAQGIDNVRLENVGYSFDDESPHRAGLLGYHWHYDRWQRKAAGTARKLDGDIGFDLVHHVTLAAHWTRAGAALPHRPFVWGPVGGAVNAPAGLVLQLGPRGMVADAGRLVLRRVLNGLPPARETAGRATLTLAQNAETAHLRRHDRKVRVVSNAWCVAAEDLSQDPPTAPRSGRIVFVGRLIPWKAAVLAVRVLARLEHQDVRLHMFGEGPQARRVRKLAERLAVSDRVVLEGQVSRARVLTEMARASVMLHPALHEESGLAIAEALSLGTPVVCLDHGGPALLTRSWPDSPAVAVRPGGLHATVHAMARAVDGFLDAEPPVATAILEPRRNYDQEVLAAYDAAVDLGVDSLR